MSDQTTHQIGKRKFAEIPSNLMLQQLFYVNICLIAIWIPVQLGLIIWKFQNFHISQVFRYASPALYGLFTLVELWRLYLGFSGNLMNRVPELAGCFLLSCFPQAVICIYFAYLQSIRDFVLPVEIALNSIYLALILPETILAYKTAEVLIKNQALNFILQSNDDKTK